MSAYLDPFAQIVDLHKPPSAGMTAILVLEYHADAYTYSYVPDEYGSGIDGEHIAQSGELWLYEVSSVETTGIDDNVGHRYGLEVFGSQLTLTGGVWYATYAGGPYATAELAMQACVSAAASYTSSSATATRKRKVDDFVYAADFRIEQPGNKYMSGIAVEANAPFAWRFLQPTAFQSMAELAIKGDMRNLPSKYTIPNHLIFKALEFQPNSSNTPSAFPNAAPGVWVDQSSTDFASDGAQTRFTYADKSAIALLYSTRSFVFNEEFNGSHFYGLPGQYREELFDFKAVPVYAGETLSNAQRVNTLPYVTTYNFVRVP